MTNQPLSQLAWTMILFSAALFLPSRSTEAQTAGSATVAPPSARQGSGGQVGLLPPVRNEIPLKVGRYVMRLMTQYDLDADGTLSKDEWQAMAGKPHAIDIDADGTIRLEELTRHVADYGLRRHYRAAAGQPEEAEPVSAESFTVFQPISPAVEAEASADGDGAPMDIEGAVDELLSAKSPWPRKYYKSRAELQGLPPWFLVLDVDGDAQVTLNEFAPNLSAQRITLFNQLDRNQDFMIEPAECR